MEEWRDIPGFEGLYQASTLGRIRTCAGKTTSNARYKKRVWKQRVLKPKCKKSGQGRQDERVGLWKDGVVYYRQVARLVAQTWCEGYQDWLTVNHIDGNPKNNQACNLEWMSLADNIREGFKTGLYSSVVKRTTIVVNGSRLSFPSMAAASRFLGKNNGYISNMSARGKPLVFTMQGERNNDFYS